MKNKITLKNITPARKCTYFLNNRGTSLSDIFHRTSHEMTLFTFDIGKMERKTKVSVLCSLENLKEVINQKYSLAGTMTLLQQDKTFGLHWSKLDGSKYQNITAIFDFENFKASSRQDQNEWFPCDEFLIKTSSIKGISF